MRPVDRAEYLGYTPDTESRRLIAHGLPKELPETLGGRHRFTPLSLYVGDRLAATAFARLDGVGSFWLDVWLLSLKRGGRWILRTGGTAAADPADENVLRPRPGCAALSGYAHAGESVRYNASPVPWLRRPYRWVGYGIVRLSAEVGVVRLGEQDIMVPEHGLQALAWRAGREDAAAGLLGHRGEHLSALALP
ncbi:hypothetical protein [Nonomuraea gerenzanensis]|uniref:Uncharacterized protein n=1 Tax=Nonomuraea gerenzanensis TaxID=93944 RepID=A0A1M4E4Y9_9ACTN|nr:hypothetical protein [Nonomuraea gerenzanensis]UBU16051.1 hypothetical protein LCN96_13870 [Nonomuraea gerenzanensis]SBO93853.1 hypothetical protein BN4615_P3367 [Nonomuraea gerenzanensis]